MSEERKYFDADGNEIEGVLTKEEADAIVEERLKEQMEAAATARADADAKAKEVEALQAQVEAAKQAQANAGGQGADSDKDENLAEMRRKLAEAEEAQRKMQEETATRIAALEGDKVAQAISAAAGGNEDLAAKIKHHYETTLSGVSANTAEEIANKVANAAKLSSSPAAPNPLDVASQGGAPNGPSGISKNAGGAKVEFNERERAVGSKLGITDADREKYANDPRLTNTN